MWPALLFGAAANRNERLAIREPVSGTVVDVAVHTVGGVVKPGDRLMDIVRDDDLLVVEAQLSPQYVDRVHPGLAADVHFDAYVSLASRPVLSGEVSVVSADILTDPRTGTPYYSVKVRVSGTELGKIGKVCLHPGMQATVMVKTGECSLLAYLLRPLLRRFATALSENRLPSCLGRTVAIGAVRESRRWHYGAAVGGDSVRQSRCSAAVPAT